MTRNDAKELLPIIQAFAEGKTIEVGQSGRWADLGESINCNLHPSCYRVKPREVVLCETVDGNLARWHSPHAFSEWKADDAWKNTNKPVTFVEKVE